MFHSGTQTLISAWAALPQTERIPRRDSVDPAAFVTLMPQVFLAEQSPDGPVLRLAGGGVEQFHGRSLKRQKWLDLWDAESRLFVEAAITRTFREASPIVLTVGTPDPETSLEICLCPLRGPTGVPDRLIGLYQPLTAATEEASDVGPLSARDTVPADVGGGRPVLCLAARHGRLIA